MVTAVSPPWLRGPEEDYLEREEARGLGAGSKSKNDGIPERTRGVRRKKRGSSGMLSLN